MFLCLLIYGLWNIYKQYNIEQRSSFKLNELYVGNIELDVEFNNTKQTICNEPYIASLIIPTLNLEQGLFDINSPFNNVNLNLEVLYGSTMPDEQSSNLIIAGHNGNSSVSYFKGLKYLKINDDITVFYNGEFYKYKVSNIYEIDKTGQAHILNDSSKKTVTLITCVLGTNKQLIVIAERI